MKNGLENRHRGNIGGRCGGAIGLGGFEGTGAEKPAAVTPGIFARIAAELPEIIYWSCAVGFGGYAIGRIVGFV